MADLDIELKQLVIESLDLEDIEVEDISSEEALFGEGLGLDSIDALELGIAIKKKYNISLSAEDEDNKKHFYSINTLKEFISENLN
ncbi:MAG: phosphopantetheine-binding protein [Spirochaetales bacterium]|nr:phosphopantetheine-binding protein [Spirochaetales bacterium]